MGLFLIDKLPYVHPYDATGKMIENILADGDSSVLGAGDDFQYAGVSCAGLCDAAAGAAGTWPIGWYLSSPASFYITFTTFLSIVLVLPSIMLLRQVAQSTLTPKAWVLTKLHMTKLRRSQSQAVRQVWSNPVAWRESEDQAHLPPRVAAAIWVHVDWRHRCARAAGAVCDGESEFAVRVCDAVEL